MDATPVPSPFRPVTGKLLRAAAVALCSAPLALTGAAEAGPAVALEPGTVVGSGFDACTAPPSAAMQAWLASPYRTVGIYFGGNNRGCTQPNLTASWISEQRAAGWHFIPLYVGPQASCTTSNKKNLIDNAQAAGQGRAAAEDAVTQAKALGLETESVLVYDMEAYRTDDAACRTGVLSFMNAWTGRLHDLSYLSGFYGSMGSGVADQVASYNTVGYARPDWRDGFHRPHRAHRSHRPDRSDRPHGTDRRHWRDWSDWSDRPAGHVSGHLVDWRYLRRRRYRILQRIQLHQPRGRQHR